MKRSARGLLVLLLVASGCALTPDYERPELGLPGEWIRTTGGRESIANLPWWEIYRDETLVGLIERALDANQNLALAMARMQEAAYLVTFTRADQFPFLDVFTSAGRGRRSKEIFPNASTDSNFEISANLSFEVDLWRRFDRATEAARADLLATEAAVRSVTISLVADVASTYLLLSDLDRRLDISRNTVRSRTERLEIIAARFEKGTVPEIDVNQAEVQLAIAEAAVAQFERAIAQTEHALRVLLGRFPGPIPRGDAITLASIPFDVPAGLPSELLERRPDIVEAEQVLAAETARIGVAQALRFPQLSLTASVGAVAEGLTDLNSTDAGEWNILAGVFQPVFNSGQLKAQKLAQEALTQQTLHDYTFTLQNAFREVEDSLVAVETFRREHAARVRQTDAARNALRLSQARYDGGVVDYLEVLDSERNFFDAQLLESEARQATLTAFVNLYEALGGGWSEAPEETEELREASGPGAVEQDGIQPEATATASTTAP